MVEEIRLTPKGGALAIDVRGNLPACLELPGQPRTGNAN
jgi:hypothetical protein